jgi:hypothetical protein
MDFVESSIDTIDSTPLYLYHYPTDVDSKLPQSAKPILSDGYELCPCLIEMVQKQSFLDKEDENPHSLKQV